MGRPRFIDLASASDYYSPYSTISPLRLNTTSSSTTTTTTTTTIIHRDECSSCQATTTRVQLQRQRAAESQQHHRHVAAIVTKNIPGIRTSAAFFASLRTNLRLHASPPSSPISTPPSMRASATSLPPPSPLSQPIELDMADSVPSNNNNNNSNNSTHPTTTTDNAAAASSEDPLAGVPELKTYITTSEDEKISALRLVADSVAQMRQTANSALIYHPLNSALIVAIMALTARYMVEARHDTMLAGTTCAGIFMGALALYRYFTQEYLQSAEQINWAWLGEGSDVFVTKFGEEVIGTAVVRWVSGESTRGQKKRKAWRGEVMAWTVRMRYRKKGVGAGLLEEVVKEARKKGAETVEFAGDHANSKRILPSLYNSSFDKRDRKSRELLADLWETSPGGKGRRRRSNEHK